MKPSLFFTSRPAVRQPAVSTVRSSDVTLGLWIFIAIEALFFGSLFIAYCIARYQWNAQFVLASQYMDVAIGFVSTALLLGSSALLMLASEWRAVLKSRGDTRRAQIISRVLIGAVAALGVTFLLVRWPEYQRLFDEDLLPGSLGRFAHEQEPPFGMELFFTAYLTTTALHALHVVIGLAATTWFCLRADERECIEASDDERFKALSMYWHFVVVTWTLLFPLFYLVR